MTSRVPELLHDAERVRSEIARLRRAIGDECRPLVGIGGATLSRILGAGGMIPPWSMTPGYRRVVDVAELALWHYVLGRPKTRQARRDAILEARYRYSRRGERPAAMAIYACAEVLGADLEHANILESSAAECPVTDLRLREIRVAAAGFGALTGAGRRSE